MKCKCGTENPAGAKFCNECGSKLEDTKTCPKPECGKSGLPSFAKFCPDCGSELEKATVGKVENGFRLGNLLISDRNLGAPKGDVALNYSNDKKHPDHKNRLFKGNYYTWEEALTACPHGWRLPTKEEFEVISAAMQFSGDKAYLEDSSGNRCYFPLSGLEDGPSGVHGFYWSSTESESNVESAWYLNVGSRNSLVGHYLDNGKSNGFSVRCVKTAY